MENISKILIGFLIVSAIGMLSMVASYPKVYSPYSFTVVIPTLFVSSLELPRFAIYVLGTLPLSIFYIIWSLLFTKPPYLIPKPTIILAGLFVILSLTFNISAYKYGIEYQGQAHTFLMYGYNITIIGFLTFILKRNMSAPNIINSLGFNIVLFSWLGWVAFPWLGELI